MWAYRGKSPVNSPLDRLKHSFWDYGNLILDDFRLLNLKYGESDGTPLQYSCLQNPMDGGAWLAAVHGVSKSRTRLTDLLHFHFSLSCIEGNGNPLQCSCLENPSDGGAWWAAIHGVVQSQT